MSGRRSPGKQEELYKPEKAPLNERGFYLIWQEVLFYTSPSGMLERSVIPFKIKNIRRFLFWINVPLL
jgi:hypothetical protein